MEPHTLAASLEFPAWIRVSHFLNLLFIGLLIRSGIEILVSHPRLYLNDGCTPGSEWLKFTNKQVPTDKDVIYTAREDEVSVSPWVALPGRKNIGIGRHWHGVSTTLWLLTGGIYMLLLFATGEWSRLIPTSWDVFPHAWDSVRTYLSLETPPLSDFRPYDGLQQLTYAFVVFVLAPFMLLTGAAMSPAIAASAPWYIKLLGGRQVARSLHFIGMVTFALFSVFHTIAVLVVHPRENITNIVLGGSPERLGLAVAIAIPALLLVVAIHVWATRWSLRDPRGVQVALDRIQAPVRQIALHNLASGQFYKESDISPYHWVNGAPPKPDESPEFIELARDGFRDWRLEVHGLVKHPLSLSLEDIRALPDQTQITKHNCVRDGQASPSGGACGWPRSLPAASRCRRPATSGSPPRRLVFFGRGSVRLGWVNSRMSLGLAPRQADMFATTATFCDGRVAAGSIYGLLHRECHRLFPDEMFADLFCDGVGRRSVPPMIVAVVMVLQRVEGCSDREAVDRFTYDVRWKYAAGGLEFDYPGFVHTVLVDMRARLGASERPDRIFEVTLEAARGAGVVGRRRVFGFDGVV